jgi:drug/metabolite transporter (DMT)-like permease
MTVALRGALWMGGAVLSFSLMAIAVRELLRTLGAFEILFLRSVVSLVIMIAVVAWAGMERLRTQRFGLHVLRNLFHLSGQYAWVYSIAMLPLATVFAIEFTMPVWSAVLAVLLMGERLNHGRVVMLALGLVGILIILKPGVEEVPVAALVMLLGSFAYAATMISTKQIAKTDSAVAVLFWMSLIQLPLAFIPALGQWVTPRLVDLPWILAVGVTGLSAHFCLTRSLRIADATLVIPIDFLRLPLIAVVGMAFYGEPLEVSILIGAVVIFAGTYYSIRRESH